MKKALLPVSILCALSGFTLNSQANEVETVLNAFSQCINESLTEVIANSQNTGSASISQVMQNCNDEKQAVLAIIPADAANSLLSDVENSIQQHLTNPPQQQ